MKMFNYIVLVQNISLQKMALFQYRIIFKYNIDIILKLFCVHNKIATSVDFLMI